MYNIDEKKSVLSCQEYTISARFIMRKVSKQNSFKMKKKRKTKKKDKKIWAIKAGCLDQSIIITEYLITEE